MARLHKATGASRLKRALLLGACLPWAVALQGQARAQAPATAPVEVASSNVASQALVQTGPVPRLNPTGRLIELTVPLRDRFPLGQVAIRITTEDRVLISAADLGTALSRIAIPEVIQSIAALPAEDGFVALDALQGAGLAIAYNSSDLELAVDLAATSRQSRGIAVGYVNSEQPIEADTSSGLSFYLAYRSSLDYVYEGTNRTGLRPPRIDLDFNGRLSGLVSFENELTYDGDAETEFARRASRLIYDMPTRSLRFTAGDLLPTTVGFQDSIDVLGLSAARLLGTFRPDRVVTAASSRTVTLSEAATVAVIVNGVPVRTLRLDSGVYNLSDLPLTGGANNVELVIEDDAGGRRVVSFDFFEDFDLLAPGVDEFDLQGGFRSRIQDSRRRYFTEDPVFTGFYRRGLTPQLTAGANMQLSERAQLFGVEAVWGTPLGLFSLESSVSNIDGFGTGQAHRFQYRYSTPLQQLQGARRFDLQAEYRSRSFGGIETTLPRNPVAWRLSARYAQPLTRQFSLGLGVDYNVGRDGTGDQYSARGSATWALSYRTILNVSGGYDNRERAFFGVNLTHRFGRTSTLNATYDSRDDQASLTYTRSPVQTLDVVAIAAQVTRTPEDVSGNATAVYRSNRGDFEFSHRAAYSLDSDEVVDQVSSLRVRGAVAFAGGRVALGRFLNDSFAIISAHPSLGGAPVSAPVIVGDSLSGRTIARTGTFGPALVPLSSYSRQRVGIEVPQAPTGYDLGAGNFDVYPWLNSGFAFTVGSAYNVTVLGTLLDENGQPVPLLAGTARMLDNPDAPTVGVYSNRAGRFGASGMGPGRWRMSFGERYYDVEITESQGSFVNFGPLRPSGRQEESR